MAARRANVDEDELVAAVHHCHQDDGERFLVEEQSKCYKGLNLVTYVASLSVGMVYCCSYPNT